MFGILVLGFLSGIAHAFETDHLAAIAALVSGRNRPRDGLRTGAMWGLGHSLTLLVVGAGVMLTGTAISPELSARLELLVGLMLLALGASVLWRLHRDRVHFHPHRHGDGQNHLHLHSHRGQSHRHDPASHAHTHPDHLVRRSLAVGIVHGLAGSAALMLVAAAAFDSLFAGLGYIVLFGAGSILGMASMSLVLALPMAVAAHWLTRAHTGLQLLIGLGTIGVGAHIIYVSVWGIAG